MNLDADAAQILLELNGKHPMKRSMQDAAEPEKNKRQKLTISDVDTSVSMKGMSLKDMLNSADILSADHKVLFSFRGQMPALANEPIGHDVKVENRKIISLFWSKLIPGIVRPEDESAIINDDAIWRRYLSSFFSLTYHKQIRQLISDFILHKIGMHVSDVTLIPWKVISDIGISGWPENLEIENVWGMDLQKVHLVASKLDEFNFRPGFAQEFEKRRGKPIAHNQDLQKSICHNIRDTLSKQIGVFLSNIPWKDLKREDFINWPEDVPVMYPVNLSIPQKLKLNDVVDRIRIKDEASDRIRASRSAEIHLLRKEIISTLRLKLKEQLGYPVTNIPWKNLKSSDILNWPPEVPIDYPNLLTTNQNKQIVRHLQDMKFSDEFLEKMSQSIANNAYHRGKTSSHIVKDLRDKLNFQMGTYVSGIPWKEIIPGDIIGWPEGITIKHPHQLNASEKEIIIENLGNIKFSDAFVERLKSKKICVDLRKFVASALRTKLAKELGTVVAHIPWKEMTLEDVAGWPSDVPIKYPNLLTANQNKKIMDNMDLITFTPAFILRCKNR